MHIHNWELRMTIENVIINLFFMRKNIPFCDYHTINLSHANVVMWKYSRGRLGGRNDFLFLFSCISTLPARYIRRTRMACAMTLSVWVAGGLWVIHIVNLKCLTRFLHSPSKVSICGPHGPAAGLSHAPSAQAAQARGFSRNPSPAGSTRHSSPLSSELLPFR